MLTFAEEIRAISAAVEAEKAKAADKETKPSEREKRRILAEEVARFRSVIVQLLSSRPSRKRWTTSEEISDAIGTSAVRAAQVLLNLKSRCVVESRRINGKFTEWKLS